MSLYPSIPVSVQQKGLVSYGKELAFDFDSGSMIIEDGKPKVVEGLAALQVWVEKTIRTARYRFPVYSFAYGCELEDIIGLDIPRSVLESEIPRVIREALIYDDRIADVRDFILERGADWLRVEFTVDTVLGDTYRQEMTANV